MTPSQLPAAEHVCFVNSLRGLGGAELWFLDAAHGLAERGVRTSLVAQPRSRLLALARERGIEAVGIPIRCDGAPWTLLRLWHRFRRAGVTALITNLTKDLKAAGLAGRLAGVPVRLASRESDIPLKSKVYYRWYFREAATGLLVNSEATRRTVLASAPWLDPSRVHLLYKGIDLAVFQPRGPAVSARPPAVGYVGQFIERKGLRTLMAAWERLEAAPWPAGRPVLRLAGEGPLASELARWRARRQRADLVELCGFVADVPAFWADCRCAVLPSRSEGFGLAAAEAAACGLPVVATRTSSLPELGEDGATGLLVPADEPAALAAAIQRLLQDGDLCARWGAAGRQLVARRFDREDCLDRLYAWTCPGRARANAR